MTASIETDLMIVGSGMAGMSAAVFAANRGINTLLVGCAGGFEYSSGLLDLWGISLTRKKHVSKKPWDMLAKIPDQLPDHPYAKLKQDDLKRAFSELTGTLEKQGLAYTGYESLNSGVVTPFGTLRPTYRLPVTMKSNMEAFKTKDPTLILDFKGLREFSAVFFKEVLKKDWPGIRTHTIEFPGMQGRSEVFTSFLARSFETEETQTRFICIVKPLLKGETYLGVPAILGMQSSGKILNKLEKELDVKIFEVPTSPVSVPGTRLKEAFLRVVENTSVTHLPNQRVSKVLNKSKNGFEFFLGSDFSPVQVRAKSVILATGRFIGHGLAADRRKIYETLLGLPVMQPESRRDWHHKGYFNLNGHPLNCSGLMVDKQFRPVDEEKNLIFPNLYAAGSILSGQDWMRQKCGSGLSIGTAYQIINSGRDFYNHSDITLLNK